MRPPTERDWHVRKCLQSVLPITGVSNIVAGYAQEFQGLRYDPKNPNQLHSNQRAQIWLDQGPLPPSLSTLVDEYADISNNSGFRGHSLISCACVWPNRRVAFANWGGVSVWDGWGESVVVPFGSGVSAIGAFANGFAVADGFTDGFAYGSKLAIGMADGSVHVWHDSGDILTLNPRPNGFVGVVSKIAFLLDGRLVAGTTANEIRAWDVDLNVCQWGWDGPTRHTIKVITALSDGGFAFACGEHKVWVYDHDFRHVTTLSGHCDEVRVLAELPGGNVASGSQDMTVRVWVKGQCIHRLAGHALPVTSLAVLTNDRLASASFGVSVKVWHVPTGACLFELVQARPVRCLVVLPDGKLAVGSDEIVEVWDAGQRTHFLRAPLGHVGPMAHLSVMCDGQLVWGTHKAKFSTWV